MQSGADGKRTTAPVTVGNPGGYIPSGAMVEALLTFVVLSDGNASAARLPRPGKRKSNGDFSRPRVPR